MKIFPKRADKRQESPAEVMDQAMKTVRAWPPEVLAHLAAQPAGRAQLQQMRANFQTRADEHRVLIEQATKTQEQFAEVVEVLDRALRTALEA